MYCVPLAEAEARTAGTKASGLAFLLRSGLPSPAGFVLTADAFRKFSEEHALTAAIEEAAAAPLDQLALLSAQLQQKVLAAPLPESLERHLREAYEELSYGTEVRGVSGVARDLIRSGRDLAFVMVRPSFCIPALAPAGAEAIDPAPSFAGIGLTLGNVRGFRNLEEAVKRCWAAALGPAALRYHQARALGSPQPALVVQRALDPEKSGVLASADPRTGDLGSVLIESMWGLGEPVTAGALIPDHYRCDKATGAVLEKRITEKPWLLRRDSFAERTVKETVLRERVAAETLNEAEVHKLCEVAQTVERASGRAVELEWAVERGRLFLLQLRPATLSTPTASDPPTGAQQASGIPTSPGIATGQLAPVSGDLASSSGKILLAPRADRELLALLPSAAGAILGAGGALSAAAVLCREFRIPCIAGVAGLEALSGEIMLDGASGTISTPTPAVAAPDPAPIVSPVLDEIVGTELLSFGTPAADADGLVLTDLAGAPANGKQQWFLLSNPAALDVALTQLRTTNANIGLLIPANAPHEFRALRSRVDLPVPVAPLISAPAAALAAGEFAADGAPIFFASDQLATHAQAGATNEAGVARLLAEAARSVRAAGGRAYFLGAAAASNAEILVEAGARGLAAPPEALPALRQAALRAERRLLLERARKP